MSKKTWIIGGVAVLAIAGATILGRSLNHANDSKGSTGSNKVTTLKVAHTQNYVPYDFVDEKGESDGYEVAVLKAIDEKLPDYKFEYTGTSDDDLLIGLESGKYDIGTKGAWYTEERAKKFIIPKEPIGASIIGFTVRKEDADKYKKSQMPMLGFLKDVTMPSLTSNFPLKKLSQIKMVLTTNMRTN